MPDLRDRFQELGAEVAGLPRPAPSEIRRAAERRRAAARVATAAACATVAGGAVLAVDRAERGPAQVRPADGSPSASRPASTPAPAPARAWLPAPWSLVSASTTTWAAGTPSEFRFCGRAETYHEPVAVAEQVLAHPSGQRALLVRFTPRSAHPSDLFKLTYADCLVPGRAEGVGGPRNVWSYGAVAGASEMAGPSLRVAELTGPAGGPGATRDEAEAALDAWTG